MWIKVCGICRQEDILQAKAGAQAMGFSRSQPRQLPKNKRACKDLPKGLFRVGVFVDEKPEEVERIARFVGLICCSFTAQSQQYCSYLKSALGPD